VNSVATRPTIPGRPEISEDVRPGEKTARNRLESWNLDQDWLFYIHRCPLPSGGSQPVEGAFFGAPYEVSATVPPFERAINQRSRRGDPRTPAMQTRLRISLLV